MREKQWGASILDSLFLVVLAGMLTMGGITLYQTLAPAYRTNVDVAAVRSAASTQHVERYRPRVPQDKECMAVADVARRGMATFGTCPLTPTTLGYWVEGPLSSCDYVAELSAQGVVADLMGDGEWNLEYGLGRQAGVLRHVPTGRSYDWTAPSVAVPHSNRMAEWQAAHSFSGEITTTSRTGEGARIAGTLVTCAQVQAAM